MKLLRLVYCRRKGQDFSLDPFTYAYHPVNAKRIAGIRSDNILFRDVMQPQANREIYDTEFSEQAEKEDYTKCIIQNTNYFVTNPTTHSKNKCMYAK